jgi:hypothetical protein
MEKLIEDLIERLMKNIEFEEKRIKQLPDKIGESNVLMLTGKLFAYEYCIKELKHIIKYYEEVVIKPQ